MGRSISIANMSFEEVEDFVGQPNFEEIIEEVLPMSLLKAEEKRNRKFDGEFLGFRRPVGSYNQNWPWKDE